MVAHGKVVLTSYRIECYNALRSVNVFLFMFTTSKRCTLQLLALLGY